MIKHEMIKKTSRVGFQLANYLVFIAGMALGLVSLVFYIEAGVMAFDSIRGYWWLFLVVLIMSVCSTFVSVVGAFEVIGILRGSKRSITKKSLTVAGYLGAGFIQLALAIAVFFSTMVILVA
ncbi:MAG: hypothetical protein HKL80_08275 [Acidimicrobiales bacterium]|nr:hypothetical protein [Acidimicrobiales bacterium]